MKMFNRILIANRGEIAVRVARTCFKLGVEYVAVYSEADRASPHLQGAVQTICLGEASAANSYLNIEKIVTAAVGSGCEAVHPGYGFLSENPDFAKAVEAADLTFIGPSVNIIEQMGDKSRAKSLMRAAGVPVVPGSDEATEDVSALTQAASQIGYPVLLKPVAGGGGKGMVIVEHHDQLRRAIESAIRVARANFKDGRLLVEKYIAKPRHIEVQVFGDAYGNVVHLFERECSLQRRHQKIVEEAPASNLNSTVLTSLRECAVAGALSIQYTNAGTFEFIVDENEEFYFLEVNTRLQVEHPVSEMITGLDLVEWQLIVAAGNRLPLLQEDIKLEGHAIECRVYAEDPSRDFAPSPGRILALSWPDVRVDSGVTVSSEVSPYYDPMIGKIIAFGSQRAQAMERMRDALGATILVGVDTNLDFLNRLLACDEVQRLAVHTRFVDDHINELIVDRDPKMALACASVCWLYMSREANSGINQTWTAGGFNRLLDRDALDPAAPLGRLFVRDELGQSLEAELLNADSSQIVVRVEGACLFMPAPAFDGLLLIGSTQIGARWAALQIGQRIEVQLDGLRYDFSLDQAVALGDSDGDKKIIATMPGVVVALYQEIGATVQKGDPIAVIEAMKMENTIIATCGGVVSEIKITLGDRVDQGVELLVLVDGNDASNCEH